MTMTKRPPSNDQPTTPAEQEIYDAEQRRNLISGAGNMIEIEIAEVIQRGIDPAEWFIVRPDGEQIACGRTKQFRDWNQLQSRLIEGYHKNIKLAASQRDIFYDYLIKGATHVAPTETRTSRVAELLIEYLDHEEKRQGPQSKEQAQTAFTKNQPFIDEQRRFWLHESALRGWLQKYRVADHKDLSRGLLGQALTKLGFVRKRYSKYIASSGKPVGRSYHVAPSFDAVELYAQQGDEEGEAE